MKKRIFALAVIAICIAILASTTLAYFTDTATARNVITSGGIEVLVLEQQMVNGTPEPYPEAAIPVMPGAEVSKIVTFQSIRQPAWMRGRYSIVVYDENGTAIDIPAEELSQVIRISPAGEGWTEQDGWWYYETALASGAQTTPLLESVTFSGPDMDNNYQNCTVEILVTAQVVQQANNGSSIMEAQGWPEE